MAARLVVAAVPPGVDLVPNAAAGAPEGACGATWAPRNGGFRSTLARMGDLRMIPACVWADRCPPSQAGRPRLGLGRCCRCRIRLTPAIRALSASRCHRSPVRCHRNSCHRSRRLRRMPAAALARSRRLARGHLTTMIACLTSPMIGSKRARATPSPQPRRPLPHPPLDQRARSAVRAARCCQGAPSAPASCSRRLPSLRLNRRRPPPPSTLCPPRWWTARRRPWPEARAARAYWGRQLSRSFPA